MAIAINGAGTITGISAGGLPDGVIQAADLASGVGGKALQIKYTVNSTYSSATNVPMPYDDTIPEITDGITAGVDTAIPASSASNILVIQGIINGATNSSGDMSYALFQDSTTNALAAWKHESNNDTVNHYDVFPFIHVMLAGTTSETTFRVRLGAPSGTSTTYVNGGQASGRNFGGVARSILTVTEYTP